MLAIPTEGKTAAGMMHYAGAKHRATESLYAVDTTDDEEYRRIGRLFSDCPYC